MCLRTLKYKKVVKEKIKLTFPCLLCKKYCGLIFCLDEFGEARSFRPSDTRVIAKTAKLCIDFDIVESLSINSNVILLPTFYPQGFFIFIQSTPMVHLLLPVYLTLRSKCKKTGLQRSCSFVLRTLNEG